MIKRLLCVASVLVCQSLPAADEEEIRTANLEVAAQWHAANTRAAETAPHLTVLPRVLVDTTAKTVSFYAEATGIAVSEPVEFFLIGEKSGNAYEALAVALAEPGDIAAGLRLLGLPEGRSANPEATRFWPKGERVIMTFNGRRAEELLLDARTGKPLPSRGLVYTGSQRIPSEKGSTPELAAQVRPPFAIASNYNEPDSILDVPWQAPQSAVYSHQAQNPEFLFPAGERILVVITPKFNDGQRRVQDLRLTLSAASPDADGLAGARFRLENITTEAVALQDVAIDRLTAAFAGMIAEGKDLFVQLQIAGETPLQVVRDTAAVLRAIDTENGIRMEPPPEGSLYYQAFTPNEQFRERANRFMHPWELHLDVAGGAVLTRIDEHWKQGEPKPDITTEDIPITEAQTLESVLNSQKQDVRGIYVFAPPSLTHGSLITLLKPVLATHPHIHVYLQPAPGPTMRP
jgi:hypothetical protein